MSDHRLDGVKPEQISIRPGMRGLALTWPNAVRVYNDYSMPDHIAVQITSDRTYATAKLTRDQISKLIECLRDCLDSGIV